MNEQPRNQRGRLTSATEVPVRHSHPGAEPPDRKKPNPTALVDAADDHEDTGVRSAESLTRELGEHVRTEAALRQKLELAETELKNARAAPPAGPPAKPEGVGPSIEMNAKASAGNGTFWVLVIGAIAAAGLGGGYIGSKTRETTIPATATQGQLDLVGDDAKLALTQVKALAEHVEAKESDAAERDRLVLAYMCSTRRLLAEGVRCDDLFMQVQVNPDPLSAKRPPELVIHGMNGTIVRWPSPRKLVLPTELPTKKK